MLPFEDRYTRQRQLPEVGVLGQRRLFELEVRPATDAAGVIEALYLERAGVRVTADPVLGTDPELGAGPGLGAGPALGTVEFRHAARFRFPEARDFAAGTHRALLRIRRHLNLNEECA